MAKHNVVVTSTNENIERGLAIKNMANNISVVDQESYDRAAEFLSTIKTQMKAVEEALDPQCKAAYAAWQTANSQKKAYLAPYQEAEAIVKKVVGNYQLEQKRLTEEAERQARELAAKEEERERKRLIKQGRTEEAEMVFVPVIVPAHEVIKAEGVSTITDFDVEIYDLTTFIKALAAGKVMLSPDEIFTVKTTPIKQYIKLTKNTNIPGVYVKEKVTVSVRGKK